MFLIHLVQIILTSLWIYKIHWAVVAVGVGRDGGELCCQRVWCSEAHQQRIVHTRVVVVPVQPLERQVFLASVQTAIDRPRHIAVVDNRKPRRKIQSVLLNINNFIHYSNYYQFL